LRGDPHRLADRIAAPVGDHHSEWREGGPPMLDGKYVKPLHFNQALSVASPAVPSTLKEFFYKPGKDKSYDP
jgi:hypothetical protein